MVTTIERAAEGGAAPGDLPALELAHSRASKSARMAALLHLRLTDEQAARDALAAEAAADVEDPVFEASEGHKLRVERIVDRVIQEAHDDEEHRDRLSREVHDRLDDEDLYGEVMSRPVGELVAVICRDMGLRPDWRRLGEEAWAVKEKAEAPAGSPFAALPVSVVEGLAWSPATGPP